MRKLSECAVTGNVPGDGTEVSCNELEFDTAAALAQIVAGCPTRARFNDRFRNMDAPPPGRAGEALEDESGLNG
jgi:hypothetical protein